MFSVNDPSKGGSFYLQSKIYRSKEVLEKEVLGLTDEIPPDGKPAEEAAEEAAEHAAEQGNADKEKKDNASKAKP